MWQIRIGFSVYLVCSYGEWRMANDWTISNNLFSIAFHSNDLSSTEWSWVEFKSLSLSSLFADDKRVRTRKIKSNNKVTVFFSSFSIQIDSIVCLYRIIFLHSSLYLLLFYAVNRSRNIFCSHVQNNRKTVKKNWWVCDSFYSSHRQTSAKLETISFCSFSFALLSKFSFFFLLLNFVLFLLLVVWSDDFLYVSKNWIIYIVALR